MPDDVLKFDDHRRQREDAGLVRCFRCSKMILGSVTRCPECGVHFDGAAEDFAVPSNLRSRSWTIATILAVVIGLIIATVMSR